MDNNLLGKGRLNVAADHMFQSSIYGLQQMIRLRGLARLLEACLVSLKCRKRLLTTSVWHRLPVVIHVVAH